MKNRKFIAIMKSAAKHLSEFVLYDCVKDNITTKQISFFLIMQTKQKKKFEINSTTRVTQDKSKKKTASKFNTKKNFGNEEHDKKSKGLKPLIE